MQCHLLFLYEIITENEPGYYENGITSETFYSFNFGLFMLFILTTRQLLFILILFSLKKKILVCYLPNLQQTLKHILRFVGNK